MIQKDIRYFGHATTIACDEQCWKAWGTQVRPKRYFVGDPNEKGIAEEEWSKRVDDYVYLPDSELGEAPVDPGTTEGWDAKPQTHDERLNKWCCRQCERCVMVPRGEPIVLPNMEDPDPNYHSRRKTA